MRNLKVFLITGGDSSEREVSLDSGRGVYQALVHLGHDVVVADPARPDVEPGSDPDLFFGNAAIHATPPGQIDNPHPARRDFISDVLTRFEKFECDVVFNGLHGGAGEDGTFQAVLEYLGIRYTGSGVMASAAAMNKDMSKRLASLAGVPVAKAILFSGDKPLPRNLDRTVAKRMSFPVVVKPNNEGSSVGVTIVRDRSELDPAIRTAQLFGGTILVETYIPGREITVAVVDGCELPLLEIKPKDEGFFDYKNKYQKGACEYVAPAEVKEVTAEAILASARKIYDSLGCRGYARIDFRLSPDGYHFFLEANTLPGLTSGSLVPRAARAAGIDYPELVDKILQLALPQQQKSMEGR
jgi:D-alanine-D-alanine ligase